MRFARAFDARPVPSASIERQERRRAPRRPESAREIRRREIAEATLGERVRGRSTTHYSQAELTNLIAARPLTQNRHRSALKGSKRYVFATVLLTMRLGISINAMGSISSNFVPLTSNSILVPILGR
jgi:hypothetical protein